MKTTLYINNINIFLKVKLTNNKINFLTFFDLSGNEVKIRNMDKYNKFKSKYFIQSNCKQYCKNSILQLQNDIIIMKKMIKIMMLEMIQIMIMKILILWNMK